MRFSLRDLLLFVAFAAGVAWCAAQVGFDNTYFWFAVAVSAGMSALFIYLARWEKPRRRGLLATVPVLLFSVLYASLALFVNAVLLLIAGIMLTRRGRPTVRTLCKICMASGLVALAIGVVPGVVEVDELKEMRRELPIVSLVKRLRYETRRHSTDGAIGSVTSEAVVAALSATEQTLDENRTWRTHELKLLHNHQYELFVRAMGFGLQRMIPVTPGGLQRPPLHDIGLNETAVTRTHDGSYWRTAFSSGNSSTIESLHTVSRLDFLDPDAFGFTIEGPSRITGFIEHGFHYPPAAIINSPPIWRIMRLELVSLLKFDEPRVYVLDHLPRMDQLSSDNAPTRPLDAFESEALAKLWHNEDVVVKNEGDDYRMLGSLRAAKQCLDCHSVQRGELLGAFSYSLRRESASKRHSAGKSERSWCRGPIGPEGNSRERQLAVYVRPSHLRSEGPTRSRWLTSPCRSVGPRGFEALCENRRPNGRCYFMPGLRPSNPAALSSSRPASNSAPSGLQRRYGRRRSRTISRPLWPLAAALPELSPNPYSSECRRVFRRPARAGS